jgi:hypothetical protein
MSHFWVARWLSNHGRWRWRRARHWRGILPMRRRPYAALGRRLRLQRWMMGFGMVPPECVLGFSLVTLRRDLADLDERLAEQVRG